MKNVFISYKSLLILSLTALIMLLIPLIILGLYAVPAADDFSYGAAAHQAYLSGGLGVALKAALGQAAESYMSWQGTFSAIFLMASQPAVYSEGLYWLTTLIMLLAIIGGNFYFLCTLLPELFSVRLDASAIIAALLSALCIELMPSPVQGLYWFNGAVYYVLFHGLLLTAAALALRWTRRGGAWRLFALCLLCVFIGGGNYVTALTAVVLALSALALCAFTEDRRGLRLIAPTLLLLAAFAVNMAAPGNAVRQAANESPGVVNAVLMSFENGLVYGAQWFSMPLLGVLIFLLPLLWRAARSSLFNFRFPALVTLYSFCLFSAMFCPPIYAMGNVGDKRLLNAVYFFYVLLVLLNLFYWLGWWVQRRGLRGEASNHLPLMRTALCALALALCLSVSLLSGTGFSSPAALGTLRSGEAAEYSACAQRRFEQLNDPGVTDAVLEEFPCTPYLLYFDDIQRDPADWRNVDMATFYGKNSVMLAD